MATGVHGIGKTSLGASAPNPIFLRTEDGLGTLDVATFPLLKTYDNVMQAIGVLYTEEHKYETLVLDSVDHLEPLIWAQACKDNNWTSIEDAGFGKGYVAALDHWRALLDGLKALRDERGMTVFMIAHTMVSRFDSPESDPYDRYVPKLHKFASALLQETVDCLFFANYRVSTVKSEVGFKKTVTRAVGGGDRVLYTEERPAFLAKNRYDMPPSIPMLWSEIATHIPALAGKQAAPQTATAAEAAE